MKQTIEIDVPEGKKAVWKDNKIIFEDIKPQLPKTWEEFCKSSVIDKEYFIGTGSIIIECKNTLRHANNDKNLLPSEGAAKAHLALMQLHQLRDCYRQGWKPDWNSNYQEKYILEFEETSPVSESYTSPYFLAFQSKEIAEEFKNNFIYLIKQAKDLIYI